MTIVASWGGNTSNAYVDLTYANSFIPSFAIDASAWTSATSAQQSAAIKEAARQIDTADPYIGTRYYSDQRMVFPRAIPVDTGYYKTMPTSAFYGNTMVKMQTDVQEANCLQALFLLRLGGRNTHAENMAAGISQITEEVGPIRESVTYGKRSSATPLGEDVQRLLSPWRTGRKIVRG